MAEFTAERTMPPPDDVDAHEDGARPVWRFFKIYLMSKFTAGRAMHAVS